VKILNNPANRCAVSPQPRYTGILKATTPVEDVYSQEGITMMKKMVFLILIILSPLAYGDDTIRGTYAYTYGDSESLISARKTCKDLALREAIESYHLYIQSSSRIDNFQTAEDIIQTISAGYVHDIKTVNQEEEGRTITITVEAVVNPEEVQKLLENRIEKEPAMAEEPSGSVDDTENAAMADSLMTDNMDPVNDFAAFNAVLDRIHNAGKGGQWVTASIYMTKLTDILRNQKPETPYQRLMIQTMKQYVDLQKQMIHVKNLELQKKVLQARAGIRSAAYHAGLLQNSINGLSGLTQLPDQKRVARDMLVQRSEKLIQEVRNKTKTVKKLRRG